MDKILTILIPTYNMEAYLERCLNSLIVCTQLMEYLEILVINDGSKDRSSEIAHHYEIRFPNSFRVIDKENGNYGSCINRGLKEATGKYIKVLDADDWFDTAEFEQFIVSLKKIDVDLVLTSFNIISKGTNVSSTEYKPNLESMKVYEFQKMDIQQAGVWMMHAVTYRVQLLKQINYHQSEGISYTDTEWTYFPLSDVESFAYVNRVVYQYFLGRDGQTMDISVMVKSIWQLEQIVKKLTDHLNNLPPEMRNSFSYITTNRQIECLTGVIYKICLINQSDDQFDNKRLMEFDSYICSFRPDLYERMAELKVKPFFPVHYVRFWRKYGKRFPVDWLRSIYRRIKYK